VNGAALLGRNRLGITELRENRVSIGYRTSHLREIANYFCLGG